MQSHPEMETSSVCFACFIPSDNGSEHFLCGAPQFRISFKPLFYCIGTAIVLVTMAWCGMDMECVNTCEYGLCGVGKLLCEHVGRGVKLWFDDIFIVSV